MYEDFVEALEKDYEMNMPKIIRKAKWEEQLIKTAKENHVELASLANYIKVYEKYTGFKETYFRSKKSFKKLKRNLGIRDWLRFVRLYAYWCAFREKDTYAVKDVLEMLYEGIRGEKHEKIIQCREKIGIPA